MRIKFDKKKEEISLTIGSVTHYMSMKEAEEIMDGLDTIITDRRDNKAEQFLNRIAAIVRNSSSKEDVAFGILTLLDGESLVDGQYALRPINEDGEEGIDIAGQLHELFLK